MKIKVHSEAFATKAAMVAKAIASKSPMPVLENIYIKVENGETPKMTLMGSDGTNYISSIVEVKECDGDCVFLAPVKTLLNGIGTLPATELVIDYDPSDRNVTITYGKGHFSFASIAADEYPMPTPVEETKSVKLPVPVLNKGINMCIFATAEDELRPIMGGIYLDFVSEDKVIFVATDSKKLIKYSFETKHQGTEGFVLPRKTASLLKSVVAKGEGDAVISYDDVKGIVRCNDSEVGFSLIEGRFPRYDAVIPKNNDKCIVVDKGSFVSVLKRISTFSNAATNLVKMEVSTDTLTLSAQDVDFSVSGNESMVCNYKDDPIAIGFRSTFLAEVCNNLGSKELNILLGDNTRPALVMPTEQGEGEELTALVMPMMLNE